MTAFKIICWIAFVTLIGCREERKWKRSRVTTFSYGKENGLPYSVIRGQVTYLDPIVVTSDSVRPLPYAHITVMTPDWYVQDQVDADSLGQFVFSLPVGTFDFTFFDSHHRPFQPLSVKNYKAQISRNSRIEVRLVKNGISATQTDNTISRINLGIR